MASARLDVTRHIRADAERAAQTAELVSAARHFAVAVRNGDHDLDDARQALGRLAGLSGPLLRFAASEALRVDHGEDASELLLGAIPRALAS